MSYKLDEQLENIYKKIRNELIKNFLKDWNLVQTKELSGSSYWLWKEINNKYKKMIKK